MAQVTAGWVPRPRLLKVGLGLRLQPNNLMKVEHRKN
jgi:hypothetical protein